MIKVGVHTATERSASRHFPCPLCAFSRIKDKKGNWRKHGEMRKTRLLTRSIHAQKSRFHDVRPCHTKQDMRRFTMAITQQGVLSCKNSSHTEVMTNNGDFMELLRRLLSMQECRLKSIVHTIHEKLDEPRSEAPALHVTAPSGAFNFRCSAA